MLKNASFHVDFYVLPMSAGLQHSRVMFIAGVYILPYC